VLPARDALLSTLHLSNSRTNETATGFLVNENGQDLLITARHVLHHESGTDDLLISGEERKWQKPRIKLIGLGKGQVDIAVMSIEGVSGVPLRLAHHGDEYFLGQEMYFLGYPMGMELYIEGANDGRVLPFFKKAAVSGFTVDNVIFLDGSNNPGFSGGPVMGILPDSSHVVFGVVTAYITDSIIRVDSQGNQSPDKSLLGNSGIVVAYHAQHILELLK
jgi:hypothetical protein